MPILIDKPNYIIELTDKGLYFVIVRGDFSAESIAGYRADALPHMEKLAPLLHLTDVSQVGEASLSSKWAMGKHVKAQRHLIRKSAVFGVSPPLRLLLGAVLRAAGRDDVHIAKDRAEAEDYLLGSS